MNKYSVISIFLALLIGAFVGAKLMDRSNKALLEQIARESEELSKKAEKAVNSAHYWNNVAIEAQSKNSYYDSLVLSLKSDRYKMEQTIKDLKNNVDNYTDEDLTQYFTDRYKP